MKIHDDGTFYPQECLDGEQRRDISQRLSIITRRLRCVAERMESARGIPRVARRHEEMIQIRDYLKNLADTASEAYELCKEGAPLSWSHGADWETPVRVYKEALEAHINTLVERQQPCNNDIRKDIRAVLFGLSELVERVHDTDGWDHSGKGLANYLYNLADRFTPDS